MEELAWKFILLSPIAQLAIYMAMVAIGMAIAILTTRSDTVLYRAPYYALVGIAALLTSLTGFVVAPFLVDAMASYRMWMLLSLEFLVNLVAGYVLGGFAVARARDAWGGRNGAWLAIIPILALWHLLTPSREGNEARNRSALDQFNSAFCVFVGIACIVLSRFVGMYLERDTEARVLEAVQNGTFDGFIFPIN